MKIDDVEHLSDVTKMVKLCICQMRILTFKIRQMQIRMQMETFILSVGT